MLGRDAARLVPAAISAAGRDDATAAGQNLPGLKYIGPTGFFGGFDAQHNPDKAIPFMTGTGGGFTFAAFVPLVYPRSYLPQQRR